MAKNFQHIENDILKKDIKRYLIDPIKIADHEMDGFFSVVRIASSVNHRL